MSSPKVLFGFHAVGVRLKTAPQSIIEIYYEATRRDARMRQFLDRAKEAGARLIEADSLRIAKLAGSHGHQGVAARVEAVAQVTSLDALLEDLEAAIPALLDALGKSLYARAEANRAGRTWTATTMDEVLERAGGENGYIKTMWCGDLACEMKMKEEAGLSSRCMPFEQEQLSDVCPCCGKPAKAMVYWGVAY